MKKILIKVGKVLAIIGIFIMAIISMAYYTEYPARNFCNEIELNMTSNEIIQKAKQENLPFFDYLQSQDSIWILNHKSPFFRIACKVDFSDGKVLSKEIIGAD